MDLDRAVKILTFEEGYRRYVYPCTSGKLTVGIGRNVEDTGVTREEAEYLCKNDLLRAELLAIKLFPKYPTWSFARQLCVCQMIFQFGEGKFGSYHSTVEAIKNEDWQKLLRLYKNSPWRITQSPARAERVLNGIVSGELPGKYVEVA